MKILLDGLSVQSSKASMAGRLPNESLVEYHAVPLFSNQLTDVEKMYERMNLVPSYEFLYKEATENLKKMLKARPIANPIVRRKRTQDALVTPNADADLSRKTPKSPKTATTPKENSPSSCSQEVIFTNVTEIPQANVHFEVSTSAQMLVAPAECSSTKSTKESAVETPLEQLHSKIRSEDEVATEHRRSRPSYESTEIIYIEDSPIHFDVEVAQSEDTCSKNSTKESLSSKIPDFSNHTHPDFVSPTKQHRGRPRTKPINIAPEDAKCKPSAPVSNKLEYCNLYNSNNALPAKSMALKEEQEEERMRNEKISKRTESTDSGLGPDATLGLDDDRSRPPLEVQESSNRSQDTPSKHKKPAAEESPSAENPSEEKYKSTTFSEEQSPTKRKRGRPKASALIQEHKSPYHPQHIMAPTERRSPSNPTMETPLIATSMEKDSSIKATPENGPPKKRPRGRPRTKPLMAALEEAKCKPCTPVFIDLEHTNLSDCTKMLLEEYMTAKETQQKVETTSKKKQETRRNEKICKSPKFTHSEPNPDATSHDDNSIPKIKINLGELRKIAKCKIEKRHAKKKAAPTEEHTEESPKKTKAEESSKKTKTEESPKKPKMEAQQKKSVTGRISISQEQGKKSKHAKCESSKDKPIHGNSGKVTKITKKIARKPISVSIPIKSCLLENDFIKKDNAKTLHVDKIEYNNNTILPEYAIPTSEFDLDKLMVTSIVAKRFVDPVVKVFSPYEEVEKIVCISCNKPFETKQELGSHMLSQHQTLNY